MHARTHAHTHTHTHTRARTHDTHDTHNTHAYASQTTFKPASWKAHENLTSFKNILMRVSRAFKSSWEKEILMSTKAHENSHEIWRFLMRWSLYHESSKARENFCKGYILTHTCALKHAYTHAMFFLLNTLWVLVCKFGTSLCKSTTKIHLQNLQKLQCRSEQTNHSLYN